MQICFLSCLIFSIIILVSLFTIDFTKSLSDKILLIIYNISYGKLIYKVLRVIIQNQDIKIEQNNYIR